MSKSRQRKSRRKSRPKRDHPLSQQDLRSVNAHQQINPDQLEKQLDLGIEHHQSGRLAEAEACYQQVLQWRPEQADAWHLLGLIAYQQQEYSTAIDRINLALQLNAEAAIFNSSLANVYQKLHNFDKALEYNQKAIQLQPDFFKAHNNIGLVYQKQGRLEEAVECYQQAIKLDPDFAEAHLNLSIAYEKQTQLDKAYTCCHKAIQLQADYADAYCQLGKLLSKQAKSKEATESYRRALEIDPNHAVAQHDLMLNLLYYSGDHEASMIAAEHRQYAERHAKPLTAAIQPHSNDRNPERRLRIGYISGDFKTHSVAYFFEPLLKAHNSKDFEVICYANNKNGDATTERLKLNADGWREIHALSDEEVAERVRRDGIDILVDLSGHTEGNRLRVFARKPAPVQVSHIGYPCTTGLETMDYRLTDVWADPEGQTEHLHTEQLVRLPHGFLCYQPSADSPDVSPPPVLQSNQVTFGSFNNLAKVNPELVGCWAEILKAVPESRLIIKSKPLADPDTRAYIQVLFQQHEIAPERLELVGWLADKTQHLALYDRVDIALDTFPYNGTTTTCEAMWMGVPVITQAGQAHVSRVGVSLLSSVGLEELIAESAEDYIQKAVDLANNEKRLRELRTDLRPRMQAAPLTDASLISRSLEDAYRTMWRGFCNQSPVKLATPVVARQANPGNIQQKMNLGIQHQKSGELQEAEACYQQVLEWQPDHADAWHLLGVIAAQQENLQTAIERFNHAIELNPEAATFYSNLGNAYMELGNLREAIHSFDKTLQLQPDHPQACTSLASVLLQQGKSKEAIPLYQQALKLKPDDAVFHSNLLGGLQYSDYEPSAIFTEHRQWAERHAEPLAAAIQAHDNDRNPERRLRIGYVSEDFWNHSVAYFMEPLLAAHNQSDFEVICYANNKKGDATTQRLRQLTDGWREIHTLNDEQVAERVRQDGIDILVDLSGHMRGNRLLVFARKPAPLQVTYIGYPCTTGLETMDYRLTDAWADPEGQTEHLHTEQLLRLPHGFLCYQPPLECPDGKPSPVLQSGRVTFGSFNNLAKVNPELVGCWAEILKAVPESRLIIKSKPLADPDTRAYIQVLFQQHEIAPERLELVGWLADKTQHLALYDRVDIALDTFPYNGTTTTCEAMWMGVPVITQAGQAHVSRVGVSLLSSLGLEELIAESAEDYMQKAIDLANNIEGLQELRANLRTRMQAAPLTNARLIAQSLENAYREMWRGYCFQSPVADDECLVEIADGVKDWRKAAQRIKEKAGGENAAPVSAQRHRDVRSERGAAVHVRGSAKQGDPPRRTPRGHIARVVLPSGISFSNLSTKEGAIESSVIGISDDKAHFIKIEIKPHPYKSNNLRAEQRILQHLNKADCVTSPSLIEDGELELEQVLPYFDAKARQMIVKSGADRFYYFVTQYIPTSGKIKLSDVVLALIEQKSLGIFQGDVRPENIRFDEKEGIAYLIDYDQAVTLDNEKREMNNRDFFKWCNTWAQQKYRAWNFRHFLHYFKNFDFDKHFWPLFNAEGAFNLATTQLFSKQMTTAARAGVYHTIKEKDIFINGERDFGARRPLLDNIQFQKGETVLDVGCSSGLLSTYLARRGCRVSGIDLDPQIINGCRVLKNILGLDISYSYHDLDSGEVPGSFDTTMLFSVIHHTKNMVENAHRIAKNSRRIVIECRLREGGAKPVGGEWVTTSGWNYRTVKEMEFGLKHLFPGYVLKKNYGLGDRNRYIMEFVRNQDFGLFNDTSSAEVEGVPISLNVTAKKPIQTDLELYQPIDDAQIKKQFDIGLQHHQAGRLGKAEACYKQVLQWQPNDADTLHLLGVIAAQQGQYQNAIERIKRAIELKPGTAVFYSNLGNAYRDSGQLTQAISYYEKAIEVEPSNADYYKNLGNAFKEQGRLDEAVQAYKQILKIKPDSVKFHHILGYLLQEQCKLKEAIQFHQKTLELQPDHPEAFNNLGGAFKSQGKSKEAIPYFRRALEIKPDFSAAHSNLLFSLHYSDYEPSAIYAEHLQWAERHAKPLAAAIRAHDNDRNPERRLRIGYVSGDFWNHSVAHFLEPLLSAHNRRDFEVICYANNKKVDITTKRLRQLADGWREIHPLDDEQVVELVRRDSIDILVDLSGHTKANRMLVFARKPAPVQVTYLGYPNTTGLSTIDYRLTDAWADPEGQTEHLHTEQLLRLPHGFLCYQPPLDRGNFELDSPDVSPSPVLQTRQITFGSFNNLAKVNPELIGCWAEILGAVPDSRLIIKSKPLIDNDTRAYIQGLFQQHGIAPERLELLGWRAIKAQHLALYDRVDIALDTFPYNGTTTTCEAMWMGVPVVTRAGKTHVSRVGVSLLSSVGLEELIAESAEDYIQKAVDLANNGERLQELRGNLRPRMQAALLTNPDLIARSLEDAYRAMWRRYCFRG